MAPPRVVERLDIIEDGKLGFAARRQHGLIEPGVRLERAPERFHRSVVVTVSGPTHAAHQAGGIEERHVICIDILAAPVGVMQEAFGRLAAPQGVPKRGQGQAGVQGRRTGPAYDAAAPSIQDRGQEQPTFRGLEVGDVGYADDGITTVMPGPGLCRVWVRGLSEGVAVDAA